jgi:hypothetical protein
MLNLAEAVGAHIGSGALAAITLTSVRGLYSLRAGRVRQPAAGENFCGSVREAVSVCYAVGVVEDAALADAAPRGALPASRTSGSLLAKPRERGMFPFHY